MAIIYCFTSTGNSLYLAKKIAAELGAEVRPVTAKPAVTDDDVVGFVYPVFYWGAPKLVSDFCKTLTIQNPGAYIFALATYGGSAPGADGALKGILRGRKIAYANSVKMVGNYLPRYAVNSTDKIHREYEPKIDEIIRDIEAHKRRRGGWYSPINKIAYKSFSGNDPACDKKFQISDRCTSCGLCAKICPVGNITLTDGRPQFSHRCQHCIACMHVCPVSAINYGGSAGRPRYIHPQIDAKDLVEFWDKAKIQDKE